MLKIFAAAVLATTISAGAANARDGGGAEPMPGISFTDMPSYSAKPIKAKHVRWRRDIARNH